jgi:hypothetical protein
MCDGDALRRIAMNSQLGRKVKQNGFGVFLFVVAIQHVFLCFTAKCFIF